tara:strand:- start:13821 stop:14132 length:312 start_codon:yes stop_codon:yes gene_type:complete
MKIIKMRNNTSPDSKVKAFFDIAIDVAVGGNIIPGALEIKGFKLIEGEKGMFVGSSSKKYEKDGETKYLDDVWITDPIKQPLIDLAVNEYDPNESVTVDDIPF